MEKTQSETTKNRGGRPLKKIRRSNDIRVRLTDTERFLISAKAKAAGLSISSWFRQAAKKAQVMPRLKPEEIQVFRMLAGMANNLNQLTKLAHQQGLLSIQRKCRELLAMIEQVINKIDKP